MKHYNITIIGAGPAGSTLARELGKHYSVLLVDKRPLNQEPSKLIKNCALRFRASQSHHGEQREFYRAL